MLATMAMAFVLALSKGAGLAMELSAGVVAYTGCLLLLGYLRSADMLAMRRLLAQ